MRNKKGFTLVELIAVIAILGMIMIIAVPKVYNSIVSNKKRTFIINAKNIVRQLEYDNIEFDTFTKIPLEDLGLKKISSKNIDLKNSVAYIVDDEIVLDLVGKSDYKDFYLCNVAYTNEDYIVQSTPCDNEHNFIYIDFVVDLDGGSTSQNFDTKYLSGNYLVLEIPIKANNTFLGWELIDGNSIIEQNRIKFGTESTKIKAIWGHNSELVVNLNGGTTTQKFDSMYSGGSIIVLEEPTKEGYIFKGWNLVVGNAVLSGNILTTGTTNTVIEAVWELNEFTISYELNGGIKGENSPTSAKNGSSVVISNPTKLGYIFKGWDVVGTGASISGTILTMGSSDVILVAKWEINNYAITYNLNNGTVIGNPTSYTLETETFVLNNPTKIGYTFVGWTDENNTTPNLTVTIPKGSTGDKKYIANWSINTYQINYELEHGTLEKGSPTSAKYGSTVTLVNPTREGYTFTGWTLIGESAIVSGNNLTMGSEHIVLKANWKLLSPVGLYSCANASSGNAYLFTYTGNCTMIDDGNGNWRVKFLSDGSFVSNADMLVEAFLVGGGGGGARVYEEGGGGGGGGYTNTVFVKLNKGQVYELKIGAGGGGSASGGTTSGFNTFALGGAGASGTVGGAGGSGGANKCKKGAENGNSAGGAGQGTSTYEFGDSSLTLYSGGGGGGYSNCGGPGDGGAGGGGKGGFDTSGKPGISNTGGGGGGGSYSNHSGGAGGSGIIVIRNNRSSVSINIPDYTYTGSSSIVDDGNGNWKIKFLTSGTFVSNSDLQLDAFLVGGGGGGSTKIYEEGGGGGGGGYTTTSSVTIAANTSYSIVIGSGGGSGRAGDATTAFGLIANGGSSGSGTTGGAGGSGGANKCGTGGQDGNSAGGAGQGTTTREFGESTGALYAGGGGGGYSNCGGPGNGGLGGGAKGGYDTSGSSATNNTGGGGGGGSYSNHSGGAGGSGIVIIREKKKNN